MDELNKLLKRIAQYELVSIILQLVRVCIGIAALAFLIIFAIKFYAKSKGLEKSNEKATKSNNVGLVKQ